MTTGYTRQSSANIVPGATVHASYFNAEFDQMASAMDVTAGHTHDGTVGGGAVIPPLGVKGIGVSTGIVVNTDGTTFAPRSLTAPAAGFTITNPAGIAGNPTFVLGNDLAALEGLASTGIAARTGTDTWAQRTITGTANQITVTNGDGVSGNPTLSIPSSPTLPGTTTGTFSGNLTGNITGNVTSVGANSMGSLTLTTALAVAQGGTGATSASAARTNLGSTAVGDALFTAASAAAGANTLGLGTANSPSFAGVTNTGSETITGSLVLGGATGGSQGNGTINALNLFINGSGVFRGMLFGLTLSNNGVTPNTKIDVAVGFAAVDTSPYSIISLGSTATIDFSINGAVNALDAGTIAASTTYHVYLVSNGTTVGGLASTSASSPTMPSGYTLKRRIGSVRTDGSVHILAFSQNGDEFILSSMATDANAAAITTTASLLSLTVPSGVKLNALLRITGIASGFMLVTSPDESDQLPSSVLATVQCVSGTYSTNVTCGVRTDTSGRVRLRGDRSTNITVNTFGWVDTRGRLA